MLLARKRSTGRSGSNLEQADRGPYGTRLPRERSAARHGLSLDAGLRKHAEKLEEDGGGRHAGDAAGVEGRRDLDEIGADEIEAPRSRIKRWASSVVIGGAATDDHSRLLGRPPPTFVVKLLNGNHAHA
jgi:hypothetical protein